MRSSATLPMLCLALAGCTARPQTMIANNGDHPLTLVYRAAKHGSSLRLSLKPGEIRELPGRRRLSDLDHIVFAQSGRDYVFKNWAAARASNACRERCTIRWLGEGRLSIGS